MKINAKKYLEAAKNAGIEPFTLSFSSSTETSVEVFNGEVETQQIGTSQAVGGKGIVIGKQGSFGTDAIDKDTISVMMENILESAKFGKEEKAENYFKGGMKYKKAKTVLKEYQKAELKEFREFALAFCKKVQDMDKRLTKVSVSVSAVESESYKFNSYGVKCKDAMKCYYGYLEIVAENEKGEPRSGGKSFRSFLSLDDLAKEGDKIVDKAIHSAVDFFGTGPVKGKKYKAVLSPSSFKSLLGFYLGQLDAKSVQKHLSIFEGKIGQPIASKVLSVRNTPHVTCPASESYDSEGVPTQDFDILKNGILQTYFYSVETALAAGVTPNGCGVGNGAGAANVLTIRPGRSTQEQLFSRMKNGLFITSISGLNSGINGQTLDFSLPCAGYVVKDGKVSEAVSMIIMAGNLKDVFADILAVGNDVEYSGGVFTPSVLLKQLAISGK